MKRKKGTFVGLGLLVLLSIFSLAFTVQAYNANAASDYAFQWSKNYHPDYHNYVDQTSYDEDANFVSQALIAGGLLNSSNPLPAFSDDIGCITNREALAKYLQEYEHAKQVGFKVEGFVPTSLAFGDVVFFRDTAGVINTVGIVIGYNPVRDDFDIAFHVKTSSPGGLAGNINTLTEMSLVFGLPDFYHITKPQETADKQRFYGTGIFDGQGALSAEILTPGNNYLGYIVSNQNRSEQDMVIATDTSQVLVQGLFLPDLRVLLRPGKTHPQPGPDLRPALDQRLAQPLGLLGPTGRPLCYRQRVGRFPAERGLVYRRPGGIPG